MDGITLRKIHADIAQALQGECALGLGKALGCNRLAKPQSKSSPTQSQICT